MTFAYFEYFRRTKVCAKKTTRQREVGANFPRENYEFSSSLSSSSFQNNIRYFPVKFHSLEISWEAERESVSLMLGPQFN